ncbi:circularly permuted type 2 ATP-grasp protein [Solibacillus sp. FSL H8-0538]|uniref:circularly permuted type 2 ATP-grasp protein n=1 Tax=Solibacillus sp. FSL H8-0538 TaxID=2921400 RepID=UPI0030F9BAA1
MFKPYDSSSFYDEMLNGDKPKKHYIPFYEQLISFSETELFEKHNSAQSSFLRQGITFTVYGAEGGTERTMPFDFVPIIIPAEAWETIEKGMKQRVKALNLFLHDVYNEQKIVQAGVVPKTLIDNNPYYYKQVIGANIPLKNHIFLAGIDLIRDENGKYCVLEDNLRNPSGMSYVYQNRYVMRKMYPEFFRNYAIETLEEKIVHMQDALLSHRPKNVSEHEELHAVLLTAGIYNAAYYDHVFLAKEMNITLVEGRDLVVKDNIVYLKTIHGLKRVDIIYRRIDDDFLDPTVFREDSMLGIANILAAYKEGNVAILNAIGNGVADDKAMYVYVPDMIRFYLNEEPIIDNVKTYLLEDEAQREWVLERLDKLVVKNVGASGGYDMLIGPHSTPELREEFRNKILEAPHQYIAQPTIKLSRAPAYQDGRFYPCHVDLRVFVIQGTETHVLPGGLSRVALKEGSLVVNSSQGGGGKDTWIIKEAKVHA